MDWVTCPQCGFTQIPTEKCLRCGRPSAPQDRATVAASPSLPPPSPAGPGPNPARTVAVDRPPEASGTPREPFSSSASSPASSSGGPALPPPPSEPRSRSAGANPAAGAGSSASLPSSGAGTTRPARGRGPAIVAAVGAALLLAALVYLLTRGARTAPSVQAAPTPQPDAGTGSAALDLSGRWETEFSKTLPGPPARPALKQAFLETNRDGNILAAGVLLTDPGRGGAGAGYRIADDGPQRLGQISSALAASPAGAALPQIDFIPFPAWMPARERVWRALEGQSRRVLEVRYVLLESIEDDYVVQAGVNRSGFLSYAFFSKGFTRSRGLDALSNVIHPDPGSALTGFKNLVWDFSGAADFLTLEVYATLSGPEGGASDQLTLRRAVGPKR